jgi:hypothetical protein
MKNIALITGNYTFCMTIQNFYYAIKNLFPNDNIKVYNGVNHHEYIYLENEKITTLDNIDFLFILDEHWGANNVQWNNINFINMVNEKNITVIILNVEKVWKSMFPWNEDYQRNIEKFKNFYQFFIDIEDAEKYNHKYINKCLISKYFDNKFIKAESKFNKAVFVGQYEASWHHERKKILEQVSKIIEVDIFKRDDNRRSLNDYINLISQYKYVIAPISTAISIPPRFWEILFVNSIPIQQIKPNMDKYYEELQFDDCIFFTTPEEIPEKIKNNNFERTNHEMYYEDYLKQILFDVPGLL